MPNNFLVNIRPDERAPLEEFLRVARLRRAGDVSDGARAHDRHQRRAEPSRSSSRATAGAVSSSVSRTSPGPAPLMEDNQLIAGRWWTAAEIGKPLVSISSEYQEALGLKLGDTLELRCRGRDLYRARREHPQGALGQLPAEFLPGVSARACWTAPPGPT